MSRRAPHIYVTIDREDQNGEDKALDLTEKIISLTYVDAERKADKLVLEVDNYDLSNFDDPIWRKGNFIRVGFGYAGNMSPQREVVIKKVTGFQRLRVEAYAKSVLMHKDKKNRIFEDMTRSEVVKMIAEENGYSGEFLNIQETGTKVPVISQPAMTDAALIARLARLEGFEFYVDFDGFHFHERKVGQQPLREYTYFIDQGQGDILNINIENDITAKPGRVKRKGRNPITKETIDETADNTTDTNRQVTGGAFEIVDGETATTALMSRSSSEEVQPTSQPTAEAAQAEAKGRFRRVQQTAVKMTMTTIGDPQVLAKTVVRINGIGRRLSGVYYVKEVEHVLSPEGYVQNLKLIKDGHGGHTGQRSKAKTRGLPEVTANATGKANDKPTKPDNNTLTRIQAIDPETRQVKGYVFTDASGATRGEEDANSSISRVNSVTE